MILWCIQLVNKYRSARQKGYRLENDVVKFYRAAGQFAIRINSRAQKGVYRAIDVIAFVKGVFYIIQCKYKKKYLHKEERDRVKLAATQFGATAMLAYRDRGIKFEIL